MKRWTSALFLVATATLAPISAQGIDFAGVSSEGLLVSVDGATGRGTRISGVGLQGYRSVAALEFNSTGTLFAADNSVHELLTINPSNRQGTPVGGIGFFRISDLAFHAPSGFLYAIDDEVDATRSDRLIRIDPATGQGTLVGDIGSSYRYVQGLAFDPASGNLLATDIIQHQLIRINRTTGVGTPIGPLNFGSVTSLALSPAGTLYGIDQSGDQLVTINKTTGQGSVVGPLGFFDVKGIAFDPRDGAAYGLDAATGQFLRIETAQDEPGQLLAIQLGPLGYTDIKGLALVRAEGKIYATDDRNNQLIRIHPTTARVTVVGPLRRPNVAPYAGETIFGMTCLAYRPGGQGGPARLYGADENRERLYAINRSNAQVEEDLGSLMREDGTLLYGVRALAWDSQLRTLFGVNQSTTLELIRWSQVSGRWTVVGSIHGYTEVRGMVYVPRNGLLAATAVALDGSHQAIAIHRNTAAVVAATPLDVRDVYGLIHDPFSLAFAGVASTRGLPSQLYEIDVFAGLSVTIGALGASDIEGMAFDSTAGILYGTSIITASNSAAQLVRIDPTSGRRTVVGPIGFSVTGLAFAPATGTLYGSVANIRKLVRIDRNTGQGTILADLRFPGGQVIQDCAGLAYDPSAQILYGVDGSTDKLIRIDPATGIGTPAPNPLGFPDVEGLEFDAGFLYGTCVQTFRMIRIAPTTGIGTAIGSTGYKVDGLARQP